MRIYLAGRYGRRGELAGYARRLRVAGIAVVCRWLEGDEAGDDDDPPEHVARRCAAEDCEDIAAADVVAVFGEPPGEIAGASRGGRFVELGYAIGLGKRVYVVGHQENIFCHHPAVRFVGSYETLETLLLSMKPAAV